MRALLKSMATPFTVRQYPARAPIFRQGDKSDSLMYIEKGRVWLSVVTPGGREATCGLLEADAFLGHDVLGGDTTRRQTATAMMPTEVLVVAKAHMIRLLRTVPAVADRFIAHMLARNTRLEADLGSQLLHSSEQRLARALLLLAGCDAQRSRRCELPHVSQETIAEMVGTTRSRVNRFMGKFKKLGFIEDTGGELYLRPSILHAVVDSQRGVPHDSGHASDPDTMHG